MNRNISFYNPKPTFPVVSVTGGHCTLLCNHCKAHYLQHMPNTDTPEKLKEFCVKHSENGGLGVLISGGSTDEGKVPLKEFISTMTWIKENTDLILNLHTGWLNMEEAQDIASTGADILSVDIVGSEETIKHVYGLDVSLDVYSATLENARDAGIPSIAPHICVGLDYGEIKGEHRALEISASIDPEVIVFLGLVPTAMTPMEDVSPPSIQGIVNLIKEAKVLAPNSEIAMGCMRDRTDKLEFEWALIEAGVDRLALASRGTERRALEAGYDVTLLNGCCTIPRSFNDRLTRKG